MEIAGDKVSAGKQESTNFLEGLRKWLVGWLVSRTYLLFDCLIVVRRKE